MKNFLIGRVQKAHGLTGAVKVLMYYPYSSEILSQSIIKINDTVLNVESVFGVIKNGCIVKFKELEGIDDVAFYKGEDIVAEVLDAENYSISLIGKKVFRSDSFLGEVLDVHWDNLNEFLVLDECLICLNQVSSIDENNNIYILG